MAVELTFQIKCMKWITVTYCNLVRPDRATREDARGEADGIQWEHRGCLYRAYYGSLIINGV